MVYRKILNVIVVRVVVLGFQLSRSSYDNYGKSNPVVTEPPVPVVTLQFPLFSILIMNLSKLIEKKLLISNRLMSYLR